MYSNELCDIHPVLIRDSVSSSSSSSSSSLHNAKSVAINQTDYLSLLIGQSILSLFGSSPSPPLTSLSTFNSTLSALSNDTRVDFKSFYLTENITTLHLTIVRLFLCLRSETISFLFLLFFIVNLLKNSLKTKIFTYPKHLLSSLSANKCIDDSCSNKYLIKHTLAFKTKNIILLILICASICEIFLSGYYFYTSLNVCGNISFVYFFDRFFYSFNLQILRIIALICILHYTSIASSIKSRSFPSLNTVKVFLETQLNPNRLLISLFWTVNFLNSILNLSQTVIGFNIQAIISRTVYNLSLFQLCNVCRWRTLPFDQQAVYFDNNIFNQTRYHDCEASPSNTSSPSSSSSSTFLSSQGALIIENLLENSRHSYLDYLTVIYLILHSIQFILSFKPEYTIDNLENIQECNNPENVASSLSSWTYYWFSPIISKGYRNPLQLKDIFPVNIWLKAENIWAKYTDIRNNENRHFMMILLKQFGWKYFKLSLFQLIPILLQFLQPFWIRCIIDFVKDNDQELWKGIVYLCGMITCTMIYSILNNYVDYLILKLALNIRSCLMADIYNRLLLCHNWYNIRHNVTSSQMINYVSTDTYRIFEFIRLVNLYWTSPIRIFISIYMLWNLLGLSSMGSVAVLICLLPFNAFIGSKLKVYQAKFMKFKDYRIKLIHEMLVAIKAIKLYAWENVFINKIDFWRNKEVKNLKTQLYYTSAVTFTLNATTFLVSLVTFGLFVILNPDEHLDAKKIFVSFSIFDIIRRPFANFSTLITATMMFLVSSKRIMEFYLQTDNFVSLSSSPSSSSSSFSSARSSSCFSSVSMFSSFSSRSSAKSTSSSSSSSAFHSSASMASSSSVSAPKKDKYYLSDKNQKKSKHCIELKNCTFFWNNLFKLQSINLKCHDSKLIAIVGEIGSGKSSLLLAMLGQMNLQNRPTNCIFKINGSLAYVSQSTWLHTGTIRENILFGKEYNPEYYKRVWYSCALHQDNFGCGDETMIDSNASSLSGGQKQRITLARAVYANADIYLLDDPLSALDSHVAKHVFNHVLGRYGLLGNKIRLLVTHNMTFMPQVDHIVFLNKGLIAAQGNYRELIDRVEEDDSNSFKEFLAGLFMAPPEMENNPPEIIVEPEDFEMIKEMSFKLEPHIKRMNSIRRKISCRYPIDIPKNAEPHLIGFSPLDSPKLSKKSTQKSWNLSTKVGRQWNDENIISDKSGSISWNDCLNYIQTFGQWSVLGVLFFYGIGHFMMLCSQIWLSIWSQESGDSTVPQNGSNITESESMSRMESLMNDSMFCLIIYAFFGLSQVLFILLATIMLSMRGVTSSNILHKMMLKRVISAPLWFFNNSMFGQIINRFTKDIEIAEFNLVMSIRSFCIQAFRTIFAFIMISYGTQSVWISITFIPIFMLYFAIYRYYIKTSRQLIRLEANVRTRLCDNLNEAHSGLGIIKVFRNEDMFIRKNYDAIDSQISILHMVIVSMRWLALRLELLSSLVVLITVAFCIVVRNKITPGMAGLCVTSALSLTNTFNFLIRITSDLESNIVTIERLFQFIRIPQENTACQTVSSSSISSYITAITESSKQLVVCEHHTDVEQRNWLQNGNISINKFSATHKPYESPVLKNINIDIQHGWKVIIVGRTGAGKSSLALSLFRLMEFKSGSIFISNHDISKLNLHQLRSSLAIIPQDPLLFSGTLRENLDPQNVYSDEQLYSALKLVKLDVTWSVLDKQFDETTLRSISAGQKQLLCLARALLRKPKLLVLDEATAAIDPGTEEFVQEIIQREFSDCTVLTIAHRLNTVMKYHIDRVLVLDQSRVAEFDTPEALLNNSNSIFSSLIKNHNIM